MLLKKSLDQDKLNQLPKQTSNVPKLSCQANLEISFLFGCHDETSYAVTVKVWAPNYIEVFDQLG